MKRPSETQINIIKIKFFKWILNFCIHKKNIHKYLKHFFVCLNKYSERFFWFINSFVRDIAEVLREFEPDALKALNYFSVVC